MSDSPISMIQIHEPGETPLPHAGDKDIAIGIDLGTTNSVVAVETDGAIEILRDQDGRALVPSVVAYAADGTPLVGDLARRLLIDRPSQVVSSVKRLMGRGLEDLKALSGTLPYDVLPSQDDSPGMIRLTVGGVELTPVEVSSHILAALRERAEDHLGGPVAKAVVTVPAYFDDAARMATKDAARLAGLEVLRLVNEPTAAALAYGLDKGAEGLYVVYDLGGGTFDVSILNMEKGVFQVRATGGDAALGGDDFDHAVAEQFLAERRERLGDASLTTDEVKAALMTARLAKECLTTSESGDWVLGSDDQVTRHPLTRAKFESLIEPMVKRTLSICRQVMMDAGIGPEEVKGVVLVGGSTRVPLVRGMVAELFKKEPLADIDPDEVVAVGAAQQAAALTGSGADALLLDVTPLSLGLETMGGMVEKIIPRNSPIPTAMAQEFTTYQDGQTAMKIHVVQGEREMSDQCRSLADFVLRGIPPMTAGAARIKVTFNVDADGILTVSAEEQTTGTAQQVEVKPSYGLTEDQMADMLRESMLHARDDMSARLLAESRVEANRVLVALRSALTKDGDLLDQAERDAIDAVASRLEKAVAGADRDLMDQRVVELDEATKVFAQRRMDRGISEALKGVQLNKLEREIT